MKPSHHELFGDLTVRGYSKATTRDYLNIIRRLGEFTQKHPKLVTQEEVKAFLRYLATVRKIQPSSLNVARCALLFYFEKHLGREGWISLDIPRSKEAKKLPVILSRREVARLLEVTHNSRQKALLMLGYGLGLRNSEVRFLKVRDIDGDRRTIHICMGKGSKSRMAALPDQLLYQLRIYYREYRPDRHGLLFPSSKDPSKPISIPTLTKAFHKARKHSGCLKTETSFHTLRHCFATHLLEAGKDLREIQRLMGHASLNSTMIYIHLATETMFKLNSPLDLPPQSQDKR